MAHPARTHLVHPPRTHLAARTPKSPPRPVLYPAPPSVIHFSAASRERAREGPPGGLSCDGPQPRPGGFSVYDVPRPGGCCCGFELEGACRCMTTLPGRPKPVDTRLRLESPFRPALRPVGRRRFRPTSPRCLKGPPGLQNPRGDLFAPEVRGRAHCRGARAVVQIPALARDLERACSNALGLFETPVGGVWTIHPIDALALN
jgi:hypothetical protein